MRIPLPEFHAEPEVTSLDTYLSAIRAGDREAFEAVYRALAADLIHFGAGMLPDRSSVHDIVADVFVTLWEHRATWNPSNGVRAYLFSAVRHRVIDTIRREQIHARIHETLEVHAGILGMSACTISVEQSIDVAEQIDLVFRAIDQFPETRRTAMVLYWRNDFSVSEIARIMGITQNAVYLHLNRGLRALKRLLPKSKG